jgi:pimeloyl-ACP methyl ester carboxylesterase
MNPFPIVGGRSHEQMAKDVATVVKELRQIKEYQSLGPKYNIIGHSLGGKVALMVAAKYDIEHVHTVIALDPVDDRPQELTYPKAPHRPATDLANSKTSAIHLFQSDTGRSWFPIVPKTKNATVIRSMYPHQITSLTINKGAGHMSYLDSWSDDASILTRADVHEKIRSTIG